MHFPFHMDGQVDKFTKLGVEMAMDTIWIC